MYKSASRLAHTVVAAAACLAISAGAAFADLSFPTFPNTTGLNMVGNAAVTGGLLRLTSNANAQVGASWASVQQNVGGGFRCTFTFRITQPTGGGADGFAFVIQNSGPAAIGGDGCALGYSGMASSLAVEFDTYQGNCGDGGGLDPNNNHVSIHTRGTLPNSAGESASIGINSTLPNFRDGNVHTVMIDYVPGEIIVYVDDMTTPVIDTGVNLATTLALTNGRAWVGFTGSTGGATERHDILSWTLTEGAPVVSARPRIPVITEPSFEGRIVNAQDVHMECGTFFSPVGAQHLCTDWEIRVAATNERVWFVDCIGGVERLHIHMGDGTFIGSHAGRRDMLPSTDYILRARHRDNSGTATEWSAWATRNFTTGALGSNLPLLIEDISTFRSWTTGTGAAVVLPSAAGAPGNPAQLRLESEMAGLLLSVSGRDGIGNNIVNPEALLEHAQLKARFRGGATGLNVPASVLVFTDAHCDEHTLFLPAVTLAAGAERSYWISAAGSSYVAAPGQDHSDLTVLARGTELPFIATQPGYVVEKFATGFQLPVSVAFVPNPGPNGNDVLCYVAELYGIIKTVTRNGTISDYRTGLVNFNPTGDFPGSGEQGLGCIAVDPLNGDVWATLLADNGTGTHYPRVIRLRSTDGGRTASSLTLMLNMPNDPQGQSHQISNITFGPDGFVYVHVGDGFVANSGQDLSLFRGKIIRMTRSGLAATTNPFYNAADGITARDYVFALGYRNPFGGAWRASDQSHYIVENGPSVDRMSKLVRARNMGYDGSDASMRNFANYTWDPAHAPVNIAFIETATFGGSGFPASKFDRAFVTESGPTYGDGPQELGKRIVEFVIDSTGVVTAGPISLVEYAGAGRASVVGIAAGPDGLYFTDLYKDLNAASPIDRGANLYRVRYSPEPVCCPGDIAGGGADGRSPDGTMDGTDFIAFINSFSIGDTTVDGLADMNGDGTIDGGDFITFINAFALGC